MNEIKIGSKSIGGSRPIANGHNWVMKQAGFNMPISYIPDNSYIPAGTPLCCDEEKREALPLKIAKVMSVNGTKVSIALQTPYVTAPFSVGESVIKLGEDFTTAGTAVTITAIEDTATVTEITLSAALTGLTANDFIVLANSDKKPVGTPNAIAPFDIVKEDNNSTYKFTAAAVSFDGDIFLRRIPAMPELVKTALLNSGCKFHWSESL